MLNCSCTRNSPVALAPTIPEYSPIWIPKRFLHEIFLIAQLIEVWTNNPSNSLTALLIAAFAAANEVSMIADH
jgi:hypothetical protein